MRGWRLFLALAMLLATGVVASGYALLGPVWNINPVVMHLELGTSGTLMDGSTSWNAVANEALATWNYYLLRLQFTSVVDTRTPADKDGVNNVFFSTSIYGTDFGEAVAITTVWTPTGSPSVRSEADTIFDANRRWDSYRGPLQTAPDGTVVYDFLRVALHEFGHVVGLAHPDQAGETVTAIMNSHVSDIDSLQADDIRGGQFLEGAQPGTFIPSLPPHISRPAKLHTVVHGARYVFVGSADPSLVQAIYLSNSRLGAGKLFKANGLQNWRRSVKLMPGRNQVSFYALGIDGVRSKVTQKIVTSR